AVGLIGDLQRRKINASVEPQRLVKAKAHDWRMRVIRFAGAVGKVKCCADIGHFCFPNNAGSGAASQREPVKPASIGCFTWESMFSLLCALTPPIKWGKSPDQNDDKTAAPSHAVACRSASPNRSHRCGHACAVDRARRNYRSADRSKKDRGD